MTEDESDAERVSTAITAGGNYGVLLLKMGSPRAAVLQCNRTHLQASKLLGATHAVTLQIRETLARGQMECGLAAEAEETIKEVLAARAQAALTSEEIGTALAQARERGDYA